ncbi:MAG: glycoside hydrolase family 3 N-terminal domain-containing protein [Chloroflexota bacterium]
MLKGTVQTTAGLLLAGCTADSQTIEVILKDGLIKHEHRPLLNKVIKPVLHKPDPPLDVKIGQMLLVGFQGLTVDQNSAIVRAIHNYHIGNIVLFDKGSQLGLGRRNISSSDQLHTLTDTLQASSGLPLLISTDQEGGVVNRLKPQYGFPASVSAERLGASNDLNYTYQQSLTMAQTMADVGINLNLAPVVDVNINPNNPIIARYGRSFSADPSVVTTHAQSFIRAHRTKNILCTLKHFPGHGSSQQDTHKGFVDVTHTWRNSELIPYEQLIQSGDCDAVMTAHIFNANLDDQLPATLSKPIITGILRDQLGFDGVVISDDIQMGAIRNHYSFETAIYHAVQAGVDIISIANNLTFNRDVSIRAATTIREFVENGSISEERIDQSYQRIMKLKEKLKG